MTGCWLLAAGVRQIEPDKGGLEGRRAWTATTATM